jgi:hypothetical protein
LVCLFLLSCFPVVLLSLLWLGVYFCFLVASNYLYLKFLFCYSVPREEEEEGLSDMREVTRHLTPLFLIS